MDLRVLQYFLTIAREENITKASGILHVTQPTLSRQMMQLEQELGVKLFTRTNHSIILTSEGMLFRRRAQELLSLAEKAKQELNEKEQLNGTIIIGSGELMTFSCLSEIITAFQEKHPLVSFDIYSGSADSVKDRIERGLADIGLLLVPVDIGKYSFLEMKGSETWGVYVREDVALSQKTSITKNDLLGEKIILPKRTIIQNAFANWFREDYEKLNIVSTYNLMGNAAALVQERAGIAIGLKRNCTFDNLRFIPLSPSFTAGSVLVWKKNQLLSPSVDAFISFSRQYKNRMTDD